MKRSIKKLTHEHKIEFSLFMLTCAFDTSFGIEKLLQWRGTQIKPLHWACIYLGFAIITAIIAFRNLVWDLKKDCDEIKIG